MVWGKHQIKSHKSFRKKSADFSPDLLGLWTNCSVISRCTYSKSFFWFQWKVIIFTFACVCRACIGGFMRVIFLLTQFRAYFCKPQKLSKDKYKMGNSIHILSIYSMNWIREVYFFQHIKVNLFSHNFVYSLQTLFLCSFEK